MLRCFLSDHSQWTLELDTLTPRYLREPRGNVPHPWIPYDKRGTGWKSFQAWGLLTAERCATDPNLGTSRRIAPFVRADEYYLYIEEDDHYWIGSIVKEVFP